MCVTVERQCVFDFADSGVKAMHVQKGQRAREVSLSQGVIIVVCFPEGFVLQELECQDT